MKKSMKLISLAVVGALCAAGFYAYKGKATEPVKTDTATANSTANNAGKPRTEKVVLSVNLVQPVMQEMNDQLPANGSIAPWQEAVIGSELNGIRLADVRAQVGDRVKKGQILAVFSKEAVEADLAQTKASLAEAKANFTDAKVNADRVRALSDKGAVSAQQAEQILTQEKSVEARVQSAMASVAQQQLRLKYTDVIAPDDGTISARTATVGAVVPLGQELFKLVRQNRLEWRAEISAGDLNRIKASTRVQIIAVDDKQGGRTLEGKVRTIAPTIDPQTRNAMVYVDIPKAMDSGLRAGNFVKGTFQLGASSTLVVSQESTAFRDGLTYAFVAEQPINGDTVKIKQVKVETGRRSDNDVEILSGLKAEDMIVKSGAAFLNDGDVVRVVKP